MAAQIPILFVRGTYYEVGYEVGRQFKDMIARLLSSWKFFNEVILPKYATEEGRRVYELSLTLCRQKFPQYVKELEGISAGSGVPFHKIFLLHIDSLLAPPNATPTRDSDEIGCTSVMYPDPSLPLLGHTEDASREFLNHIYIVDVEIVDENQERLEKFCSLAYAGHLPGYTMGYNSAGLIYSINTLYPSETVPGKTPRNFLTRALLAATTLDEMLAILRDVGTGTSDGFGINLIVYKRQSELREDHDVGEGVEPKSEFYNIEVSPRQSGQPDSSGSQSDQSDVNVLKIATFDAVTQLQLYAHCNKYLRICIPEIPAARDGSSAHRHTAINSILNRSRNTTTEETDSDALALAQIKRILSDTNDPKFPIYRNGVKPDECATLAVGIFDVRKKKWSIYVGQPDRSSPALILPLNV